MKQESLTSKKILLVGNPNCGKSTLFNALTGSCQRIGNWSGVTVEQKQGTVCGANSIITVIDLPGIYSLSINSTLPLDERLTVMAIQARNYDCIINVLDGANLERNLFLTVQLLEQGIPMVVVLNRMDLLEKNYNINVQQLSAHLQTPVIPIIATHKKGLTALLEELENPSVPNTPLQIPYPKILESVFSSILKSRNEIIQDLESEENQAPSSIRSFIEVIQREEGYDPDIVIAKSRYEWIETILKNTRIPKKASVHFLSQKNLDYYILHRALGIPIFLGVMYLLFFFAIHVGGAFQDFFDRTSNVIFVDALKLFCQTLQFPDVAIALVTSGVGKGLNTIITFIPVLGAMFLALSFLEDSGYMARAAFVMDRLMRAIGLPGKSFVPLIVGFGCNVPAIMGARTLEKQRDRILTVMISPFMSCGARLAIFTLFVAAFFPNHGSFIVFLLYIIGIVMAVLTGLFLKKTLLKGEPEPLILELPAYQWPNSRNLFYHTWRRLKKFLWNAGKLIIPVCLVIGTLNSVTTDFKLKTQGSADTLLASFGKTLTPWFAPMGIEQENWPATVGLFTGIMAKEVVIGSLNTLYTQSSEELTKPLNIKEEIFNALLTIPQNFGELFGFVVEDHTMDKQIYGEMQTRFKGEIGAFAYLLFVLLYFPCVSATAAMIKEVDKKWTLFSLTWTTLIAYAVSVSFFQLATFAQHPLTSTVWTLCMLGIIVVFILLLSNYKMQRTLPTPIILVT